MRWDKCAVAGMPTFWREFSGGDVFERIIAFTGEPWIMAGDEVT
jgi:hypothetical protein